MNNRNLMDGPTIPTGISPYQRQVLFSEDSYKTEEGINRVLNEITLCPGILSAASDDRCPYLTWLILLANRHCQDSVLTLLKNVDSINEPSLPYAFQRALRMRDDTSSTTLHYICRSPKPDFIKQFLLLKNVTKNLFHEKNSSQLSPLAAAAASGLTENVFLILKHLKKEKKWKDEDLSCHRIDALRQYAEMDSDKLDAHVQNFLSTLSANEIHPQGDFEGPSPLNIVILKQKKKLLRRLLKVKGIAVVQPNTEGVCPLAYSIAEAAYRRNRETCNDSEHRQNRNPQNKYRKGCLGVILNYYDEHRDKTQSSYEMLDPSNGCAEELSSHYTPQEISGFLKPYFCTKDLFTQKDTVGNIVNGLYGYPFLLLFFMNLSVFYCISKKEGKRFLACDVRFISDTSSTVRSELQRLYEFSEQCQDREDLKQVILHPMVEFFLFCKQKQLQEKYIIVTYIAQWIWSIALLCLTLEYLLLPYPGHPSGPIAICLGILVGLYTLISLIFEVTQAVTCCITFNFGSYLTLTNCLQLSRNVLLLSTSVKLLFLEEVTEWDEGLRCAAGVGIGFGFYLIQRHWGNYSYNAALSIAIFSEVVKKVFRSFLGLIFMILACFSIYIVLFAVGETQNRTEGNATDSFNSTWEPTHLFAGKVSRLLTMVSGEIDDNLFGFMNGPGFPALLCAVSFCVFLLLMVWSFFNQMTGVALEGVKEMTDNAKLARLRRKIEYLYEIETFYFLLNSLFGKRGPSPNSYSQHFHITLSKDKEVKPSEERMIARSLKRLAVENEDVSCKEEYISMIEL